jgi:hypothetical protein
VKLSQISTALNTMFLANRKLPPTRQLVPFLVSPPGLGKSSVVLQTTESLGVGFIDWRLSQMDPVDIAGIPVPRDGRTHYYPPAALPTEGEGILFLDEFAQASPSVMNAASPLILDKRIGDYILPRGWQVVLASNRRSDRANAHDLPTHIKTRVVHLNAEADADEWATWATANGGHPFVIAFIRYRKELIHKFNADRPTSPTPRTWMYVSDIVNIEMTDKVIEHQLIAGAVDDGAAAEFVGYLSLFRDLPSAREVFRNPKTIKLPEGEKKPAILYALCGLLAREVEADTMPALVQFLGRITQDYAVACLKDVRLRNVKLIQCKAYIDWASANHSVIM